MKHTPKTNNQRILWLDLLRIFATFAVIVLHMAAQKFYVTDIHSSSWMFMNIYDSLVRFAVPCFVMISGVFFLDNHKELPIKQLFQKYILRIITAFIFWSVFYVLCDIFINHTSFSLRSLITTCIDGHYHMWYLFMITGLYLIVPVLRKITADLHTTKYFLVLALIFTFCTPALLSVPDFAFLNSAYGNVYFHFTLGFSCYLVAGYFLGSREIPLKYEIIAYALGIAGILATILISAHISYSTNFAFGYYNEFTLNVLCETIAIFVFFKNRVARLKFSDKVVRIIRQLSKYSFGIYLVHPFFIEFLEKAGIDVFLFPAFLSIPLLSILIFLLSLVVSFVINKLPVLCKYIV